MSGLTRVEREALWSAWLAGDVSKGLGWLAPAVEKIIAAREQAARKDQAKIIAEAIEKMTLRGADNRMKHATSLRKIAARIARQSVEGGA